MKSKVNPQLYAVSCFALYPDYAFLLLLLIGVSSSSFLLILLHSYSLDPISIGALVY